MLSVFAMDSLRAVVWKGCEGSWRLFAMHELDLLPTPDTGGPGVRHRLPVCVFNSIK